MANISAKAQYFTDGLNTKFSDLFEVIPGRKYDKVVHNYSVDGRSVYAFIDRATGDIYMPASWKSPAKGVRFPGANLDDALAKADKFGSFLYIK